DYAHHPTEIKATLEAARQRFGRRSLVCVFQPHTYSRTKLLLHQFATAFTEADSVIIANIYPAREEDTWGISAADLAAALSHPNAHYAGDLHHVVERLLGSLKDGDVLLVLGAGDVDKVTKEVWENLKETS
ncbi:MAG: UDP-N-acetylmuramate--L-alanine ligase, partial [Chloroflexi bacterium]|nr:UDP-N-acetylmuramate--L-alanine ligase [Chloroflexota bacterium]